MSSNWQAATAEPVLNMVCHYTNSTRKMQLIRVIDSQNLYSEKIVFPQQRILFEAVPEGQLAIYTNQAGIPRCIQIIPCQNLQVNQVRQNRTVVQTIVETISV